MAVAVEVARRDGMPTRPGIGAHGAAADEFVPVHFPDRNLAARRVLEKEVGMVVLIKSPVPIAFQTGPGLGLTSPPPIRWFPFISQIETCPLLVF
jgi:hypothetical protein